MPALNAKAIMRHFETVPEWRQRAKTMLRTFKFEGFLNSIAFVQRIARKAQTLNHHPDIDIRFDEVTLILTTHDEGGLTAKDFTLARQCDDVFARFFGVMSHRVARRQSNKSEH